MNVRSDHSHASQPLTEGRARRTNAIENALGPSVDFRADQCVVDAMFNADGIRRALNILIFARPRTRRRDPEHVAFIPTCYANQRGLAGASP